MKRLSGLLLWGSVALWTGCGSDGSGGGGSGGAGGGSVHDAGHGGAGGMGGGGPQRDSGPCTPGTADCQCGDGDSCNAGLFCAAGICRVPQCNLGDEGCSCFADNTCRTGADGRAMDCVNGVCHVSTCTPGKQGCGCAAMDRCDSGLFCQDGKCLPLECTAGQRDCACADGDTCDAGLVCQVIDPSRPSDKRCVEAGCQSGTSGCDCRDGASPCDDGLRCNDQRTCETCPAGTSGCACDNGSCGADLVCQDGTCGPRACAPGTEGCVCSAGDHCGLNDRGESMSCTGGHCAAPSCTPGATGCACVEGATCTDGADTCRDGYCQPANCAPGDENCSCAQGHCGEGQTCRGGVICTDGTGFPGGACAADGTCAAGAACDGGLCEACIIGSEGCSCLAGDTCLGDLDCTAGHCTAPVVAEQPPANPRCYTPCQASFQDDLGVFHRCSADGLLAGCLDDRVCTQGSCLANGEAPPTCTTDLQCPTFQRCIAGGCYADCESDRDCAEGQGCDLRACRPTCDTTAHPCADGFYCHTADGQTGFCRALQPAAPTATPQTEVAGQLTLSDVALDFTSTSARRLFAIRNDSDSPQHVTIRKLSHAIYTADNQIQRVNLDSDTDGVGDAVDNCPWDANADQANADGDTRGDACDTDDDNDGVADRDDDCPLVADANQADADHDGVGDACEGGPAGARQPDTDGDGVIDASDDCPHAPDANQNDADHDGVGDACEPVTDLGCDPNTNCPLWWLQMGIVEHAARGQTLDVDIQPHATTTIELNGAADVESVRWQGEIEIESPTLNSTRIALTYTHTPEGQWTGTIYYFSNFGDDGLYTSLGASAPNGWVGLPNPAVGSAPAQWTRTRDDASLVERIGNAFIQRWSAFRRGRLSGGWDEFQAVLTATQTESWRWPSVQSACDSAACYLYNSNRLGLKQYSSDLSTVPVPSGIVELPFAMNLYQPDRANAPTQMGGRIESTVALHYAGNPAVTLQFDTDPNGCSRTVGGACMTFLTNFSATVAVGGRYETTVDDANCAAYPDGTYTQVRTPWLVPGFTRNTFVDALSGKRYRYSCRDSKLPHQEGVDPDAETAENLASAAANPVPDGRARFRQIELIDGALINQTTLFIIFREHFDSFLDPSTDADGFSAYGYMVLTRRNDDVDQADANGNDVADLYEGSAPTDDRTEPTDLLAVSCPADLLSEISGVGNHLTTANAGTVAMALIDGVVPTNNLSVLTTQTDEQPHYLCVETGLIDGGPGNVTPHLQTLLNNDSCAGRTNNGICEDGGPNTDADVRVRCALGTDQTDCGTRYAADADESVACPSGSEIVYFTLDSTQMSQDDIANLDCQQNGSCLQTLLSWRDNNNQALLQYPARWRCTDTTRAYCEDNRHDLLQGKTFYARTETNAVFDPIRPAVAQAFRYKTRFRNRDGQGIGFAPTTCIPDSDEVPYCYDPEAIEAIRERTDCLIAIQQNYYNNLTASQKSELDAYLIENFAYTEDDVPGAALPVTNDGFERLYAELLVLQGDESVTRAFQSRFDVANQNNLSFEGSAFEDGGIDLSGQAGYEMYSLYQGVEYYQEALDRFYALSPRMWQALRAGNASRDFVTPETVTSYFDRLIRASTQKTQAYSEIAKRYQGFNQPDLARSVVRRAYTAAYLESVVMSRMIGRVVDVSAAQDRAQIKQILEDAQRRYRVALLNMREIYNSITNEQTFMGIPPDYIPIPALDASDFHESNAFEAVYARAQQKVQTAREREQTAIESNRSFQTDAAEFQAELVRIRNTYEDQLANLCGTFTDHGHVYPAIAKYAYLNDNLAALGDPCGLVGVGQIHEDLTQLDIARTELARIRQSYENAIASIGNEQQRASQQCGVIFDLADYVYEAEGRVNNLQDDIRNAQFVVQRIDRVQNQLNTYAQLASCSPLTGECGTTIAATIAYTIGVAAIETVVALEEKSINDKESKIADIQRETARWQTETQCQQVLIDSNARVADMVLQLNEIDLEELRQEYQIQLELSDLKQLQDQATRLQQQEAETEQLQINVEAARNDPNVRVYRNDAIINADISFEDALREVYRLTLVYEYYTSQSYADKERLYFIRMVSRGDDNLENYLNDLNNEFQRFQENYGLPDTRIMVVSLKDDILAIPKVDENGRALSDDERTSLLQQAMADPERLDSNGYLTFSFGTELKDLSPLTRNHKILNVRAEIVANSFGDFIARLYLRQKGTGVIRGLDDVTDYYRLPERTAVINPYFSGKTVYDDSVYTNVRLRDRPLVNTQWDLIINQRDEAANKDIDLQSVSDIKLYIYYTDFTAL
jgi:hypothetical protein